MKRKFIYRDWDILLDELKSSGLSKAEFCRSRGIQPSVLRYNLRKSEKLKTDKVKTKDNTDPIRTHPEDQIEFARLEVEKVQSELSFLRITTPSGCVVEVPL